MQIDLGAHLGAPVCAPVCAPGTQLTFEAIGTPLSQVTFVVVDLETTGASPATSAITEIGAVKVRGGEVLGELQSLVDPGGPVPAMIATLTGITTAMVRGAPTISQVLPAFLEFSRGAVLVAHNAPFDVGFLKAAAAAHGHAWPGNQVLDTVLLARRALTRDDVPNHKLATLARYFRASTAPEHRALADARATVDVLHGLLARLAPLGITHLEDLATACDPVPPERRRKRHLADGLPDAPGVYQFRDRHGEVLYVGTSRSIRTRVRSYFTASESRRRIHEMVMLADHVIPVVCGTDLEARVRELRLIAEHRPRYNRRSRHPERMPWVRLTAEHHPRLSVVREVRSARPRGDDSLGEAYIGPFASSAAAQRAVDALHAAFPIRQCARRLPLVPTAGSSACALAGLGRCSAPCMDSGAGPPHRAAAAEVRAAMTGDPSSVIDIHARRIARLVTRESYEEAAAWRDQLEAFLRGARRAQRSARLGAMSQLVAARRSDDGGWEVVVVRHGRLAGTCTTAPGSDPRPAIAALVATAEEVQPAPLPACAAHPEEVDLVLAWLEAPGVRLVETRGAWACPVASAEGFADARASQLAVQRMLGELRPLPAQPTAALAAPEQPVGAA